MNTAFRLSRSGLGQMWDSGEKKQVGQWDSKA
jgi:hypothetical protein